VSRLYHKKRKKTSSVGNDTFFSWRLGLHHKNIVLLLFFLSVLLQLCFLFLPLLTRRYRSAQLHFVPEEINNIVRRFILRQNILLIKHFLCLASVKKPLKL
jgi:hypothetical protein